MPKPKMARVLPTRATPTYLPRCHLPLFVEASAWAMFRLRAARSAMPCSAAATVLAVGAFTTRQPYYMQHPHLMSLYRPDPHHSALTLQSCHVDPGSGCVLMLPGKGASGSSEWFDDMAGLHAAMTVQARPGQGFMFLRGQLSTSVWLLLLQLIVRDESASASTPLVCGVPSKVPESVLCYLQRTCCKYQKTSAGIARRLLAWQYAFLPSKLPFL